MVALINEGKASNPHGKHWWNGGMPVRHMLDQLTERLGLADGELDLLRGEVCSLANQVFDHEVISMHLKA